MRSNKRHGLKKSSLAAFMGVCFFLCCGISQAKEESDLAAMFAAAKKGDVETQFALGTRYLDEEPGPDSEKQGFIWLQKAAKKGHAGAQFRLGKLYNSEGEEAILNPKLALFWFQKSAEQGYAEAQSQLGYMYEYANYGYNEAVIKRDIKKAVYWYQKAAAQGEPYSQFALGKIYGEGEDIPRDLKQAAFWYQKAAEQGDQNAQEALGGCYAHGEGVARDIKQAVFWYQKAGEQGNHEAHCALGLLYAKGDDDLPRDDVQAYVWLTLAVKQLSGHEVIEKHNGLSQSLTEEQLAAARSLLAEIQAKISAERRKIFGGYDY